MKRIYLDDEREAPEGWVRTKTAPEVIALLAAGDVSHLSLDHDLGEDPGVGNGYDVLLWIEEQVALHGFVAPVHIDVHSANSGARPKMEAAIEAIQQLVLERGILPRFFELLREAHDASKAVDFFDLRSEDPVSQKQFNELLVERGNSVAALVSYLNTYGTAVLAVLEGRVDRS